MNPLVLFAARRSVYAGGASRTRRGAAAALGAYPHVLGFCLFAPLLTDGLNLRRYWPNAADHAYLLSLCAVAAYFCSGAICLAAPWPRQPAIAPRRPWTRRNAAIVLTPAAAVVLVMVHLFYVEVGAFFFLMVSGAIALPTLLFIDWPPLPRLPRFAPLPEELKAGPVSAFLFLAAAALPLTIFFAHGIRWMVVEFFQGTLFARGFSPTYNSGAALDQSTIGRSIFWFCLFGAFALTWTAAGKWMSRRRTLGDYLARAVPVICFGLVLAVLATDIFTMFVAYIRDWGWTPRRFYGMAYTLAAYFATVAYLTWGLWPLYPEAMGGKTAAAERAASEDLAGDA
jgi:hypothetical protein